MTCLTNPMKIENTGMEKISHLKYGIGKVQETSNQIKLVS